VSAPAVGADTGYPRLDACVTQPGSQPTRGGAANRQGGQNYPLYAAFPAQTVSGRRAGRPEHGTDTR
jgi:hypothetical protein